jgi:hypothetical protein
MALTITDTRTIPVNGGNTADGDAITGWTGTVTPVLFTTAPTPVEATGCLGMVVNNTSQNAYFLMGAAQDWSAGMLIYIWVFSRGEADTTANGGIAIQLGDGTNRIAFHVAGSDKAGFRHDDGPALWQCLVLDTANLPTTSTVLAGTLAALNLAAITQVGVAFKTIAKAVGGTENMFWDVVRYGNNGLTITGGTSGDPGTFEELASGDRSTATLAAHGIVRKLADKTYGVQGPLTFGDNAGTGAHYFRDTNAVVVFEDRGLTRDKYWIKVVGNATGIGEFSLGTKTGSGDTANGINGCILRCPTAAPAYIDASDADLDEFNLYGCTIDGFAMGVTLSANVTNGVNHEVHGTTFKNCGQVDPGRVVCRNNLFTGTKHFKTAAGAAIADDGGVFTDETVDFNDAGAADVLVFPATPVAADAFYIGHIAKFTEVSVLVSTASTTGTIVWEYWNGAWVTLTLTSQHTDFSRVGLRTFKFAVPGAWATTTVNSQGPFYYIRARLSVASTTVVATSGALFGPADGSAMLWNADIDVRHSSFTQNTDANNDPHGIEHPASGSFNYFGMKFSGNDFDIDYSSSSGNLTIAADATSSPGTYEVTNGGGTVTITNSKTLTVTCKNLAGLATPDIRVRIETTGGTLIAEGTTNGSGIYTASYNYVGDQAVNIIARLKGFKYNRATDTITTNGLSVPFTMLRDETVNLP